MNQKSWGVSMELDHLAVEPNDSDAVHTVYELLNGAGRAMAENDGLMHWANEYPLRQIVEDCGSREVFLVFMAGTAQAVATYQVDVVPPKGPPSLPSAMLSKFATSPEMAGRGVGSAALCHVEGRLRASRVHEIRLDVYTASARAIRFYEKRGFVKVKRKPTRRFEVWEMRKLLATSAGESGSTLDSGRPG